MPEDLPQGYYLDNFKVLLDFVFGRYQFLLNPTELDFYRHFNQLPQDAQKLYVRLSNRKGPYFRTSKISYPEIGCLSRAIKPLLEQTFLIESVPETAAATGLCSKSELLSLQACEAFPKSTLKQELADHLIQRDDNPVSQLGLDVVELCRTQELMIYKLLFFGNFHQDMTEFVLHELVAPFEQYDLDGNSRLFRSRDIVDELVALKTLSDFSRELVEQDTMGDLLIQLAEQLPARNEEPLLARRYDRMVNRVARQLERIGRIEEAAAIYARSSTAPARERQVRLMEKLGRNEEALSLCSDIIIDPADEEELEFAHRVGQRLTRKLGLADNTGFGLVSRKPEQQTIRIPRSAASVELCARDFYLERGYDAYYVENSLMRGLFGLCFWDVIYAPVSGAFFHPFQRGPVDLFTPDFVDTRATRVAERMQTLHEAGCYDLAVQVFSRKQGVANQFVNWSVLNQELLELALRRIPGEHLIKIFERLLVDLKGNGAGFPDLVVFSDSGYRLVEIKGPGDKIQKNQSRWFNYFLQQDIPADLVNVEYLQ